MPQLVSCQSDGYVAKVTLNHPPLNILDMATMQAVTEALQSIKHDSRIRALVIESSGDKAFSAGVDIREHTPQLVGSMLETFHGLLRCLYDLPIPSLAVVQGAALGGGFELVLCCDMVLASDSARFGVPEINVGCFPPLACVLLPGLVGSRRASELILLGKVLSAAEALELGLVNAVVAPDLLDETARTYAASLASKSPAVVRLAREAMRVVNGTSFPEAMHRVEQIYLQRLMNTADAIEGIEAYLNKRQPVWKGE